MKEILDLISEHRSRGVLLDANLLLLRLVGRMNPKRISNFDRTSSYSVYDYQILENLIARFNKTITTPHILTEVSNLAGKLSRAELGRLRQHLKDWIGSTLEICEPSTLVADNLFFKNFGLADAAIASICKRDKVLLMTADVQLYGAITNTGLDAINFKQIQAARMLNK